MKYKYLQPIQTDTLLYKWRIPIDAKLHDLYPSTSTSIHTLPFLSPPYPYSLPCQSSSSNSQSNSLYHFSSNSPLPIMVVAMASCGSTLGVYTKLVAFEKQPISKSAFFGCNFASDPVKHLCNSIKPRLSYSLSTMIPKASATAIEDGSYQETDVVPTPKVIIDQDSDPNATVVEITFGNRLGALLDTMNALKNLGLNVVKANVHLDSSGSITRSRSLNPQLAGELMTLSCLRPSV